MKSILLKFTLCLLVFTYACSSSQSTEATNDSETPTETEAPAEDTKSEEAQTSGENYTIKVLNADIPSPRKEMSGKIGGADVVVNYGSPNVKGREVWGALVPYGQVWRTGANEATSVSFSADVKVEGQDLKAGKYGLFTIPGEDKWTIIFNTVADQWGGYSYDESKDVLRIEVAPKAAEEMGEGMDFIVEGDALVLHWEKLQVPIQVGG